MACQLTIVYCTIVNKRLWNCNKNTNNNDNNNDNSNNNNNNNNNIMKNRETAFPVDTLCNDNVIIASTRRVLM